MAGFQLTINLFSFKICEFEAHYPNPILIIFEGVVLSSFSGLNTNNGEALSSSSLLELRKRAKAYGSDQIATVSYNTSFDTMRLSAAQIEFRVSLSNSQVRAYINVVLEDKVFLADPNKYMANWIEQCRKGQDNYPQNLALAFFIKNQALLSETAFKIKKKD